MGERLVDRLAAGEASIRKPFVKRWGYLLAASMLSISLMTACFARNNDRLTSVPQAPVAPLLPSPPDCDKPFPQVCLDLSNWDKSGIATLSWSGRSTNDILYVLYERNYLNEPRRGNVAFTSRRLIIARDDQTLGLHHEYVVNPNRSVDQSYIFLKAGSQSDHYISIDMCSNGSLENCQSSEEVVLPKK